MQHSTFTYIRLKILFFIFRLLASLKPSPPIKPDEKYQFKSRHKQRDITVHVYRPQTTSKPSPVLLNWHGSGFTLPLHGSDDLYCARIAQNTDYTVLDASYALAPEYPFPAAFEDVEDLILQVINKPEEYDTKNIVLSGFSAGANLALAVASNPDSPISKGVIRAVVAFYPPCNLSMSPSEKRTPDGSAGTIPPTIANLFNSAYMPYGIDPKDPRISPLLADADNFPASILIVTAGKDSLAVEAEELAKKLESHGKDVTLRRAENMDHAWDKDAKENTPESKERDAAYDLVIKFLLNLHN